nr:BrnA antitoxin family protein [Aureimonas sp. Leaf454]
MTAPSIRRASLEEIKAKREAGELFHDPSAAPQDSLGPHFWAAAMSSSPKKPTKSVHLKLDPDVFEFFKLQGKGHLTKMQDVLKAYVNAHR